MVKPEVRALAAYTLRQYEYRYKLNQNENPFGYPEELKAKVLERVARADWARYPSFDLAELRAKLAEHAGVSPEMVLVGNGSNELIYVTLAATLSRGDHVIVPVPTFTLYALLSRVMGATVHDVLMDPADAFALPAGRVVEAARRTGAKVVVLCSPNNPTGTPYPAEAVRRVAAESGALVLVDEAYREFGGQDFVPLLDEFDNVVLLRTFSKAMAMGGLRVGYAIMRPELAREIHKAKLPYALNLFSEAAALVALEHFESHFLPLIEAIVAERERLFRALQALPGLHVYPSSANFLLVRLEGRPAREVFGALVHEHGILVRDVGGYPGLAEHLRISVGTREENDALIRALRALV